MNYPIHVMSGIFKTDENKAKTDENKVAAITLSANLKLSFEEASG